MKNKIYWILGVILFAAGFQILLPSVFFLSRTVQWQADGGLGFEDSYFVAEVSDVEELGSFYEDTEADPGYSFYEITFLVENRSDEEAYSDGPGFYFEGQDGLDVYNYYPVLEEQESEPLFAYESEPYLPARRTGEKKEIVAVRDGVSAIRATYEPNYDSGEKILEISLE